MSGRGEFVCTERDVPSVSVSVKARRRAQDFAAEEEAEMLGEGLAAVAELDARLARWQLQRLLGGPYDEGDAVLSIPARRPWGTACSPAGWLFRAAGEASRPRSIAQQ